MAALLKGDTTKYAAYNALFDNQNCVDALNGRSLLCFFADNTEGVLSDLEARIKKTRSETGNKKAFVDGNAGLFAILALLKSGKPDLMSRVSTYIGLIRETHPHFKSYQYLLATHHFLQNRRDHATSTLAYNKPTTSIERVFYGCAMIWCEQKIDKDTWLAYEDDYNEAKEAGFNWLAMEYAAILAEGLKDIYEPKSLEYLAIWEKLEQKLGIRSIMHSVAKYESWQLSLQALSTIAAGGGSHFTGLPSSR